MTADNLFFFKSFFSGSLFYSENFLNIECLFLQNSSFFCSSYFLEQSTFSLTLQVGEIMMSKSRSWRAMSEFSLLENKHEGLGFVRNFSSEVSSYQLPSRWPGILGLKRGRKSRHPEDRPDSCSLYRGRHRSTVQCAILLEPGLGIYTCF